MEYKFNRLELCKLLLDSVKQFCTKKIDFSECLKIQEIIFSLIFGDINITEPIYLSVPEKLKLAERNLRELENILGYERIEILLEVSKQILKIPIENSKDIAYDYENDDMVRECLSFYEKYDQEEYTMLQSFLNRKNHFLEIVSNSNLIPDRYRNTCINLSKYHLCFVRIVKKGLVGDFSGLTHELQHVLDYFYTNTSFSYFNVLGEVNSSFKELYFSKICEEKNPLFRDSILHILQNRYENAGVVYLLMKLLLRLEKAKYLSVDMILDEYKVSSGAESILTSLSAPNYAVSITYVIGEVLGIHLYNVAKESKKDAKKLTRVVEDNLIKKLTLDDFAKIGLDLRHYGSDMSEYKNFVKEYRKKG